MANSKMRLIGIAGAANTGKTTLIANLINSKARLSKIAYLHMGSMIKAGIWNEVLGGNRYMASNPYVYIDKKLEVVFNKHEVKHLPQETIAINKDFYSFSASLVDHYKMFSRIDLNSCKNVGSVIQSYVDQCKLENPDFFIDDTCNRLTRLLDYYEDEINYIIVDGLRYDEDSVWLREVMGGKVLLIKGDQFRKDGRDSNHKSESGINSIAHDYEFNNIDNSLIRVSDGKNVSLEDLFKIPSIV